MGDVSRRHDEHVSPVTGLLMTAWEYCDSAVMKRDNFRRQFTAYDATEDARFFGFHGQSLGYQFKTTVFTLSGLQVDVFLADAFDIWTIPLRNTATVPKRRKQIQDWFDSL
jgi:hypothetical protein